MTVDRRIYRINGAPSTIQPGQICSLDENDADLGFRALGHTDHAGNEYLELAKDQIARVESMEVLSGSVIGTTPLMFDDSLLDGAGSGAYARFADDAGEVSSFASNFGDSAVYAALNWLYNNITGGTPSLPESAIGFGDTSDLLSGDAGNFKFLPSPFIQVHLAGDTPDHLGAATYSMYLAGRLEVGATYLKGQSQSIADTAGVNFLFTGSRGESQSADSELGHQLKTENGMLSMVQSSTESGYSSDAFARVYREVANPDACASVAELRSWDSVDNTTAHVQVQSQAGVDGAAGSSRVRLAGSSIQVAADEKITMTGRVARSVGVAITATTSNVTLDFDTSDMRDIDLNNQASVTITISEPPDGSSTRQRSMGIVRLRQGAVTPTTSITWASSGGASITWLTPSDINETTSADTYIEIWWDYLKWAMVIPGASYGGVSGLAQYQILHGAADGGIDQSGNFLYVSSGDVALSGGNYSVGTPGYGIDGVSDIYHHEKISFDLGEVLIEASDLTAESGSAVIGLKARESAATTLNQVEIVSGGSYSGDIAGSLNLRGYFINLYTGSTVDFNGGRLTGISSAALPLQDVSISSGSVSVSLPSGGAKISIDQNVSTFSLQTPSTGARYSLFLDFQGSYSVNGFPASVKWAGRQPPFSGTSGQEYEITMVYRGTDGYHAMISGPFE